MTLPGIALFYGGMVRRKSVLNVMACVTAICAIVSLPCGLRWGIRLPSRPEVLHGAI